MTKFSTGDLLPLYPVSTNECWHHSRISKRDSFNQLETYTGECHAYQSE